jgi:GNAT superfamily N-acetyltransferase
MPEKSFRILPAKTAADIDAAAMLFRAYAASLPIDLAYQGFEAELAALPGKYAPPSGALLLARGAGGDALGCVALRRIEPEGCCEMKRLYVSPQGRGTGLGKALVDAVVREARRIGYLEVRLDTLGTMIEALALYRNAGFMPIEPYYDTPITGTVFLARRLNP